MVKRVSVYNNFPVQHKEMCALNKSLWTQEWSNVLAFTILICCTT